MDSLKSIWEDLSDRLKSPFIISFVLSWLAWNWEILYAANNFGADYSTFQRLDYIKDYVSGHFWTTLTLCPFGTSILAAGIFYLSKMLFLALDTLYENRGRVWIVKLLGIAPMVPISDLEKYIKEIELERRERREQESIHATLRSEKENLLTEIQEMKAENSRYHILDSKNIELREENENLQNKLRNNELEFPRDLSNFFVGHWVCEYQILDERDIEIDSEFFLINEVEYRINGRTVFKIENIVWSKRVKLLTFSKKSVGHTVKYYNIKLLQYDDNLWVGMEDRPDRTLAYIRLYPIGNLPNHYMSILKTELADKVGKESKDYRDYKYDQLNSISKSARSFS